MEKDTNCPTENLGKSEQCQGCPNQTICGTITQDKSVPLINSNMSHFKLIIVVMSGKGGVGKSTITRNIADKISNRQKKTLLLDLDLSGPSIPKMTNLEGQSILESNNIIYPIKISEFLGCISTGFFSSNEIYTSSFKTNLLKNIFMNSSIKDYEYLIIDTPPNITDEHLGIVNYLKIDYVILVTTPQTLSFQDVKRQITFCKKNKINILGLVENMKGFECEKCKCHQNIFNDTNIEKQCKNMDIQYLGYLSLKREYAKMGDEGQVINNILFDNIIDLILNNN